MIVEKVIVMVRLADGDDIKISVTAKDKPLRNSDFDRLINDANRKFGEIDSADVLYYTIRTTLNGKKDNYKFKDWTQTYSCLEEIFGGLND